MSFKPLAGVMLLVALLLSGCAAPSLPQTAERDELMERIFAKSTIVLALKEIDARGAANPEQEPYMESADASLARHKKQMNVDLPAAYWAQRRENLMLLTDAKARAEAKAMVEYREKYLEQLSRANTSMLAALANSPRMDALPQFPLVLPNDQQLSHYYMLIVAADALQTIDTFYQSMAVLDAQYGVCALYKDCYRPDFREH